MTAFDYAVIAVMAFSMLLGWWRGLVYEAVTFLSWIAAYIVARVFCTGLADYMPQFLSSDTIRLLVAFVALFILTLTMGSVLAWVLNKMIKTAGLTRLDGSLGALFGMLRGMIVVMILVLAAGTTNLPETPVWNDAFTSGVLQEIAVQVRNLLPDELAQKIHYQN